MSGKNKIGFLDIELRDVYGDTLFKIKNKKGKDGISEFEKFCRDKLGIYPFDVKEFEKKLEEKYKIRGVDFR